MVFLALDSLERGFAARVGQGIDSEDVIALVEHQITDKS
jgi:hypothetical protein